MKFKKLKELNGAVMVRMQTALGTDCNILAHEVEQGQAELWECDGGESYLITRVDYDELVLCCYEGKNVKQMMPHLIAAAQAKGLKAVTFFTDRPGVARMLKEYKPVLSQYVYRIEVADNG